ncbi:DUF4192 family protein [uncultured Amnibacterium sp.]|uniref:DUF4192 family protein n=1 Tax=uncultured Amnibacterium sp. TaxID=1631851 RepID=UPI0035CA6E35
MTTPTVVKADSAADFLRLVPRLVGMRPARSLVLAAFSGSRTGSALRVDLPAAGADLSAFADLYIGLICRIDQVDGIAAVAYTDATHREAIRGPEAALLHQVATCADRAGLTVKSVFMVAADGWSSAGHGSGRAAQPLATIQDDPVGDGLLDSGLLGRDLLDIDAAVRLSERPPAMQHRFERAVAARLANGADDLLQLDPSDRIEGALTATGSGFGLPDDATVLLAAALRIPALRDIVLLQIGWGAEFGSHAWRRGGEDRPVTIDEPTAMAFTGGDMARPDPARIERAIVRLKDVAALTPQDRRAPVLTSIAWLHWALGRGTLAGRFVDLAQSADPGYSLTRLIAALLANSVLPEWAYRDTPFSAQASRWRTTRARPPTRRGRR